jgi:hypothetical protein
MDVGKGALKIACDYEKPSIILMLIRLKKITPYYEIEVSIHPHSIFGKYHSS